MDPLFPIFMAETPRYEISGDLMHIKWRSLEIVLPVSTMLAGMVDAKRVIDDWRVEQSGKVESIHAARP